MSQPKNGIFERVAADMVEGLPQEERIKLLQELNESGLSPDEKSRLDRLDRGETKEFVPFPGK